MSSPDQADTSPPDARAFDELEQLVRALGEEMGKFRRRAQTSELKLKDIEASVSGGDLFTPDRVLSLEAENKELRERLERATARTRAMLERVRFLRQQTAAEADA